MDGILLGFVDKFGIETGIMVFLMLVILKIWKDQVATFKKLLTDYRSELNTVNKDVRENLHSTLQNFHNTLDSLQTVIKDNHKVLTTLLVEMERLQKDFNSFAGQIRSRIT
jgi:peptidoglycan hydrolase CwlO-like protein